MQSPQALDRPLLRSGAGQTKTRDTQVINLGDRVFYIATRSLATCVILLALLLVGDLFRGSWEAIGHFGFSFLTGTTWDPVARQFGTLPTITGTIVKAAIGLLLAVSISIGSAPPAAIRSPP